MFMVLELRVWDCDGGDSEAVRDLRLGNRKAIRKKEGED